MKIITLLMLSLFASFFNTTIAQNPEWLVYTDGNTITCFDDDGTYLWIGTEGGLVRRHKSDNTMFRFNHANSGMPDNWVKDMVTDIQGNHWIATNTGGLVKFDGTNWITFNTMNSGIASNRLRAVDIDNSGNIWVGSVAGVSVYDGSSWITYNTSNSGLHTNSIFAITIDEFNTAWIGTGSKGLYRFDGTTWTNYPYGTQFLPGEMVTCITIDNDNTKWIGTNSGVACYDDINFTQYLSSGCISGIEIAEDGSLWIGTVGALYNFDGTDWTVYGSNDMGTENDHVTAIDIEEGSDIYVGLFREGMLKFEDGWNWINIPFVFNGPYSNVVHDVAFDDLGNPWFAGNAALMHFNGIEWTNYTPYNSIIPNNRIEDIEITPDGVIWLGTFEGGLLKFENGNITKYTTYNSPLPSNTIRSLKTDQQGVIWMGTSEEQILSFDGVNWTTFEPEITGVPDNDDVWAIDVDANNIKWFGTYYSGNLLRYDGISWTSQTSNMDHLSYMKFNAQGQLWCAFGPVLKIFDDGIWLDPPGGLPYSDKVYIDFDLNGNVWVAAFLSGAAKLENDTWTLYNQFNSPISSHYTTCAVVDPKGNKWFGCSVYEGTTAYNENGVTVAVKQVPLPHSQSLTLYPNPVGEYLFIPKDIEMHVRRIQFINMQGLVIYNRPYNSMQQGIPVSNLPPGIYIFRLITDNGDKTGKFIVK